MSQWRQEGLDVNGSTLADSRSRLLYCSNDYLEALLQLHQKKKKKKKEKNTDAGNKMK